MIAYIAGYGRSGSTVLEVELAKHASAFPAGELCNLYDFAGEGIPCQCGLQMDSCSFWAEVVSGSLSAAGIGLATARSVTIANELGDPTDREIYEALWSTCLQLTREQSGSNCVIDGSKTAGGRRRLEALSQTPGLDLRAIHLTRAAASVIESVRSGDNREMQGLPAGGGGTSALRGASGWVRANRVASRATANLPPEHVMHLSFETLVADMAPTVSDVAEWLGLERQPLPQELWGHGIAGNRMRRSNQRSTERQPRPLSRFLGAVAGRTLKLL